MFLDLSSIAFFPPRGGGPSQFGAHGEPELESVCKLADPPPRKLNKRGSRSVSCGRNVSFMAATFLILVLISFNKCYRD